MARNMPAKSKKIETLFILVKVYQLVLDDVEIFWNEEEAYKEFKKYTGFSYDQFYHQGEAKNPDYDQTKIFEVRLPTLKKHLT